MARVSIHLIVYNQKESQYIPYLFDSLKNQTFTDWEMKILNNNADGDVIHIVESEMQRIGKPYTIITEKENGGFANGHNTLAKKTNAEYVLLLNPDMYLESDALEKMISFLDEHKEVSNVSTRLMQWDFAAVCKEEKKQSALDVSAKAGFTQYVDAIGIRLLRNRRAVEWLTGEVWTSGSENKRVRSAYNKNILEIFGLSGAFLLYRKAAIDHVLLPGECLFDPTYHSYKEDVDLAYRLRNAGYTSYVLLDTAAYHDRTGSGTKKLHDLATIKNKKTQSYYIQFHSYKNHLRTLYKNEYWQNVFLDFPCIFWYELRKFVYLLCTNPRLLLRAWQEIVANFSYTKKARESINASKKMYWKGLRRWFSE